MDVVLMAGRVGRSGGDVVDGIKGKEPAGFHGRNTVVHVLTVNRQLAAEDVIDLDHFLAKIVDIAQGVNDVEGPRVDRGAFRLNVFHVSGGYWTNVADGSSVGLAGTIRAVGNHPTGTNRMKERSVEHPWCGDDRRSVGIRNNAARFFGNEKECFILLFVDLRNPERTAERAPEVVITQPGACHGRGGCRVHVEVLIRVQIVVAEELINPAMKGAGPGAGGHIDSSSPGA